MLYMRHNQITASTSSLVLKFHLLISVTTYKATQNVSSDGADMLSFAGMIIKAL